MHHGTIEGWRRLMQRQARRDDLLLEFDLRMDQDVDQRKVPADPIGDHGWLCRTLHGSSFLRAPTPGFPMGHIPRPAGAFSLCLLGCSLSRKLKTPIS